MIAKPLAFLLALPLPSHGQVDHWRYNQLVYCMMIDTDVGELINNKHDHTTYNLLTVNVI